MTNYPFYYREATANDISKLAKIHSIAWRETYEVLNPQANFNYPSAELREHQWQEAFKNLDGSWFCYVAENTNSEIIGFAKGKRYNSTDLPGFAGELNKIYLLRSYHKKGIGLKLLGQVVKKFIEMDIFSMVLFSEPQNPTGRFFEKLGAEKIYAKNGEFHGGYGWTDLKKLATICNATYVY
ncbi:GNAT family N-acetyltransferase [Algoriphagus sp.]|uniref:GNAT family N-acetyltransferase n=1 Tax=Algoriphagus sp. TaxID=1872435 RepID=UPI0027352A6A|nr:GNAT family N-acetyltransferase [Algoriphagus sp.]